jgi:hypothetical protein
VDDERDALERLLAGQRREVELLDVGLGRLPRLASRAAAVETVIEINLMLSWPSPPALINSRGSDAACAEALPASAVLKATPRRASRSRTTST